MRWNLRFLLSSGAALLAVLSRPASADFTVRSGETATATQTLGDSETGTIESGGAINVTGLRVDAVSAGSKNRVSNSGVISTSGVQGYAIQAQGENVIFNLGTMSTLSDFATGIGAGSGSYIVNSGTITTRGPYAYGIEAEASTILNSGYIYTMGQQSYGVEVGSDSAVVNTGTVVVSGFFSRAVGLTTNNVFTNSGTLISEQGESIFASSGNTINLLAGTAIQGKVDLSLTNNTMTFGNGLSAIIGFMTDVLQPITNLPDTVDTNGMPYVMTSDTLAVADTTGFALADEMLDDAITPAFRAVHDQVILGSRTAVVTPTADLPAEVSRPSPFIGAWAKVYGVDRTQDHDEPVYSASNRTGGFVGGIDGSLPFFDEAGIVAGLARGKLEVDANAQDVNADTYYGGLYGRRSIGSASTAGFTLLAGRVSYDSTRRLADTGVTGGVDYADASYGAWFISPELSYDRRLGIFDGGLAARYTGLFIDAYDEKGQNWDLSVDSRVVNTVDLRAQLSLPWSFDINGGSLELVGRAGANVRFDDDEVSGELLGQAISFDPSGGTSATGVFASASGGWRSETGRVAAFLDLDAAYGTDKSTTLSASAGLRIAF